MKKHPRLATLPEKRKMGSTTDLRRELKRYYFSELESDGFVVDQRNGPEALTFRRVRGERLQFVSIQWEHGGGPRFKLAFGAVSPKGTFCRGEHIRPGDVGPGTAPVYLCLYPTGNGSSTRHWFRQDRTLWNSILTRKRLRSPYEVVVEVRRLHSQVADFFRAGIVGPNCRQQVNPRTTDAT